TGEVKCLGAIEGFAIEVEPERWPADRKRPPDYSPYGNVTRVRPGAVLHVDRGGATRPTGGSPLVYHPAAMLPADQQADVLDAALLASARAIAGAERDWGAFLSGGI